MGNKTTATGQVSSNRAERAAVAEAIQSKVAAIGEPASLAGNGKGKGKGKPGKGKGKQKELV